MMLLVKFNVEGLNEDCISAEVGPSGSFAFVAIEVGIVELDIAFSIEANLA